MPIPVSGFRVVSEVLAARIGLDHLFTATKQGIGSLLFVVSLDAEAEGVAAARAKAHQRKKPLAVGSLTPALDRNRCGKGFCSGGD